MKFLFRIFCLVSVPRESPRAAGTPGGNSESHPVRKERLSRSKQELAEEAAKVLDQVDKIDCYTQDQSK